ncbi:MAG: hypothetical protein ACFE9N_11830 [Promethearchaeota archaeon]
MILDKKKAGFVLSIIGGLSSIGISFLLVDLFPNLASALGEYFIIIQAITIIGGIITLIGTAIALFKIKVGKIIILISGIVAGGNIITIIGAILLSKLPKQAIDSYNKTFPYICNSCREFSYTFSEYCENCGAKGSIRKATERDYEARRYQKSKAHKIEKELKRHGFNIEDLKDHLED